jgi:hypothetical protein
MAKINPDFRPENGEAIGQTDYDAVPVIFEEPGDSIAGYYIDRLSWKPEGKEHETHILILRDARDPTRYYRVKETASIRQKMEGHYQPDDSLLMFVLVNISKNKEGYTFKKFNIYRLNSVNEIPYD